MADVVEQSGHGGSVDVTFEGDVGVITMRRGQNRINEEFVAQMNEALDKVLANPRAKAVITTGEGRFYSNGLDLDWLLHMLGEDSERVMRFFTGTGFTQLALRLLTFPLPTIALINGHAFAGGCIISSAHDHVIMQDARGWWCANEVHILMRFSQYLIELLKAKLPPGRPLTEAVVLGRRFTADEAKEAGIVHEVCTPQQMLPTALAWVKAVVPPNGFDRDHLQIMKEDVYKNIIDLKDIPNPSGSLQSKM